MGNLLEGYVMNFLRFESGKDYIELKVTGYKFENISEDWLMVYGKISVNGECVEGEDPVMFVYEFTDLKLWAEEMLHNKQTSRWGPIEPNLNFEYNKERNELTIFFYPEHDFYKKEIDIKRNNELFFFTKKCENLDWKNIIKWCDEVIKNYPSREKNDS